MHILKRLVSKTCDSRHSCQIFCTGLEFRRYTHTFFESIPIMLMLTVANIRSITCTACLVRLSPRKAGNSSDVLIFYRHETRCNRQFWNLDSESSRHPCRTDPSRFPSRDSRYLTRSIALFSRVLLLILGCPPVQPRSTLAISPAREL